MNLYEAIFCRKSVRTYTNDEISPEVFEDFRRHYREIPDLFGGMGSALHDEYGMQNGTDGIISVFQGLRNLFSGKHPHQPQSPDEGEYGSGRADRLWYF